MSGLLYCPHDLSSNLEFRDDLPTLLGNNSSTSDLASTNIKCAAKCSISIYDTPDNSEVTFVNYAIIKSLFNFQFCFQDEADDRLQKVNQIKFVSPYARYLAMLPLAEQQRLEELAEQQRQNKTKKLCPDAEPEEYVSVTVLWNFLAFQRIAIGEYY